VAEAFAEKSCLENFRTLMLSRILRKCGLSFLIAPNSSGKSIRMNAINRHTIQNFPPFVTAFHVEHDISDIKDQEMIAFLQLILEEKRSTFGEGKRKDVLKETGFGEERMGEKIGES
jgi:hypothetical protein